MEKKAGCYEYLAGGFLLLLQDTITSSFVQKHAAPWVPPLLRMNDFCGFLVHPREMEGTSVV